MLISMDILAHELKDFVAYQHLQENTKLEVEFFQILDATDLSYHEDFVYILLPENHSLLPHLPEGTNIICVGRIPEPMEQYQSLNLIVISGVNVTKAINIIISVFHKYRVLYSEFKRAIQSTRLKNILNAAASLLQTPLCMMDLNHSTLAMSTNVVPVGDSLWDAMAEGYGYQHYSIVSVSIPNVVKMDEEGINVYDGISNISGRYIRVYLLRRGTKGVSTLGLHKHTDCSKPFERWVIQLADHVVKSMSSQLNMFSEVTFGRGKLYEQFLIDLLDDKPCSAEKIDATMENLAIQIAPNYLLGMVLFKESTLQTDYHFALMDYIETLLPRCKCAMHNRRIVVLIPLSENRHLSDHLRIDLPAFLDKHNCFFLLSNPFDSLLELSRTKQALEAIAPYVTLSPDTTQIYYYYQFSQMHAIYLLSQALPLQSACHQSLLQLIQYDQENRSDYYKTLVAYLRNNCNLTESAKELQMHRNSMLYRINKIEAVLNSTLDDSTLREQLLFSIQCLEFQEQYGNLTPTATAARQLLEPGTDAAQMLFP